VPQRQAIRLRASIRSGNEIIDNNAVVDALPEVADDLIGRGVAEPTDAVERHPSHPLLDHVDEVLISGAEKFPKPAEIEPATGLAATGTEVDRRLEAETRSNVGPTFDHPDKVGDESSPAKVPAAAPTATPPAASKADDSKVADKK
jgi:hypothetical protein